MTSLATTLKETYLAERPIDAARLIEKVPQRELIGLFDGIQSVALARCLDYLSGGRAVAVFQSLDAGQQGGVLSAAPPRLAVALLDALPDDERDALLATLPASDRKDLVRLRSFDEGTAGRLLDRPYDTIRTGMTVAEALEVLRRSGAKRTRSVYVVDSSNKLVGKVDMQSMAVADAETTLDALLEPLEGSVTVTSPRKEIVEQLERFRVDSLPVTDVEGRLLGVVRHPLRKPLMVLDVHLL